jgi:O-antigen/teichoic acid export membrane protein
VTNQSADPETRPVTADDALRAQQMAGLAALIRISVQVSGPQSGTSPPTVRHALFTHSSRIDERRSPEEADDFPASKSKKATPKDRLGLLAMSLRTDHLVRNSLYLMLSSGITAVLGFTFWVIMARLYNTDAVGRASSLISATSLITFFSLFGLNSTLMRFLPTARNKHSLVTTSFTLVACTGAAIGLAYILLTPLIAPRLAFVEQQPARVAGFVLLTSAAAVNQLTDSVFIATRKASLCALTDGAVGGVSRIVFGVILAGSGSYGLYSASVGGMAAAALASIGLIVMTFRWRPTFKRTFRTLRPLLRFSGANYVANAIELLPTFVVPLIVLDRLGTKAAAYYFVAFQITGLLYAAVYAVESAFMAEGSQAAADWRAVRRRSRRFAMKLFVPGGAFLALTAHWVLLAFGSEYSQHSTTSLQLLAASVIPLAACNWSWTVLRLSGQLAALMVSNAAYSIAICGSAWILASHGLTALTAAWPLGSALAAVVASVLSARASSEKQERHRTMKLADGGPIGKPGYQRSPKHVKFVSRSLVDRFLHEKFLKR